MEWSWFLCNRLTRSWIRKKPYIVTKRITSLPWLSCSWNPRVYQNHGDIILIKMICSVKWIIIEVIIIEKQHTKHAIFFSEDPQLWLLLFIQRNFDWNPTYRRYKVQYCVSKQTPNWKSQQKGQKEGLLLCPGDFNENGSKNWSQAKENYTKCTQSVA